MVYLPSQLSLSICHLFLLLLLPVRQVKGIVHEQLVLHNDAKLKSLANSIDPWDPSELFQLHRQLVQIESVTGHEHDLAAFLDRYLSDQGLYTEAWRVPSDNPINNKTRYNIYAFPSHSRDKPILMTSHIDTVPPFYNYSIHSDGSIWGRGVVDDKACVAAQIIALLQLLSSGTKAGEDTALLFVVGEETGGDGMRAANDMGFITPWETVIFGEPTELRLASGHKGLLGFTLHAKGKGGHSGYPELGKNANLMLIRALTALTDLQLPSSDKYGNSTLNIGKMEGGVAANVIAENASAKIGVRLAGGTATEAKALIMATVHSIDKTIEVEWMSEGYGPVHIDSDVDGFETIIVNYGTDIPNLEGDHKRYLYGPGSILVAHSDHEALFPDDLSEAVVGYKRLVKAAWGSR